MFSDLKAIIDIVRGAATAYRDRKRYRGRKEAVLMMFEMYFLLKDCVDEGESLVKEAGHDPVGTLAQMDQWKAQVTLKRWDRILSRQGHRLSALEGYVAGQDHLTIIDPSLQERIIEIIGSKFARANSLHAIGAALVIRNMFPLDLTVKERAGYVLAMVGAEDDVLDPDKIKNEIASLRTSLDDFRLVIEKSVSPEELLTWSREARRKTISPRDPD